MKRCDFRRRLCVAAGLLWATGAPALWAQPRPRPVNARRGVLRVTQPPWVLLDGEPAQLSPGARIFDAQNRQLLSGALIGQDLAVAYRTDTLGLIHLVWLLSDDEIRATQDPAQADTTPPGR